MVHLHGSLLFPSLVLINKVQFKSWNTNTNDKTTFVYKLDWEKIDNIKKENWKRNKQQTSESEFPGTLPQKYNKFVNDLQFSIPTQYMDEIRRNSRQAQLEWATNRHFDTTIKEICLQPSIEYAYVAFRLLTDCLYDPKTNYFYRGHNKSFATQALLYKFWAHQTGRSMIRNNAKFNKINDVGLKNRVLLLSANCDCGERAFIEATSPGWKIFLKDIDLTCSCGKNIIRTNGQDAAGFIKNPEQNDDSEKFNIKEFLNSIDEFEKNMDNKISMTSLTSVTKSKESSEYDSEYDSDYGYKIIKKIDKEHRPVNDRETQKAWQEIYNSQVDPKTEEDVETLDGIVKATKQVSERLNPDFISDTEKKADRMFISNLKKMILCILCNRLCKP
jgi:hypothetical protein